ncbi:MAG: ATP-binding cassette domain-containing protein [Clostridia bacterium]|nr:ATP-binding cassette domain-containing protein [Clostridia bacterium]
MITVKNLTIQYIKEYATIFDLNFCIDSNTLFISNHDEITALFRTMTNIEKRYLGSIEIDNQDIKTIKDKDLSIAYVCNTPYLFKFKSIKENLIYPLKIRKYQKHEINEKYQNILNKYLIDFTKNIRKLTLSQQKIITLLRAIIWNPKYIILEHFFDDLDEKYYNLAQNILKDISKNTIIIASENQENDTFFGFKQVVLENGSIKNGT